MVAHRFLRIVQLSVCRAFHRCERTRWHSCNDRWARQGCGGVTGAKTGRDFGEARESMPDLVIIVTNSMGRLTCSLMGMSVACLSELRVKKRWIAESAGVSLLRALVFVGSAERL